MSEPAAPAPATPPPTPTLAAGRLAILLIKTVGTATLGVLMGVDWSEMSTQQQVMALVAIAVNAATAIEAFFDKTMTRLSDAKAARLASGRTAAPFGPAPTP